MNTHISDFTVIVALLYVLFELIYLLMIIIRSLKKKSIRVLSVYCVLNFVIFATMSINNDYISLLAAVILICEVLNLKKKSRAKNYPEECIKQAPRNYKIEPVEPVEPVEVIIPDDPTHSYQECSYSSTIVYTRDDIFSSEYLKKNYDFYKALINFRNSDFDKVGNDIHIELLKVDSMDGITFEHYVADLLTKNGFTNVKVTSASNDYGVDVTAYRLGDLYAVQCKNYSSALGNSCVQEVCAGMKYYTASKGVVITNSYFTQNAKILASQNNTELWDRDSLIILIEKAIRDFDTGNIELPDTDYSNLFNDAVSFTVAKESIKVSDLQKTFDLRFSEALKIIQDMKELKIVDSVDSTKSIKVITDYNEIEKRFSKYEK